MAKRKAAPPAEAAPAAESYTVLARRYRPQGFEDLVGQEPVAQALKNALAANRVAHAYLFTGARGVGKTSTARILAKCLNCVQGPTATPCNICENCKAIAVGDDMDVLEIDAASNTGVENIRDLRANVQFRPSRSRNKIYIIDEVHMLSKAAFNALLKTLEEPPPHVKFIFATTEADKIPITILSRCQRFDFAGIGTPRIVQRLREIVASEKMEADDEALELLARRAAGSMRDAQSLLDQLLAFGSQRLTVEQVHRLLGTASDDRVAALAAAAVERDPKRALELLASAADEGLQLGEFVDQLIAYWRDLMVVHAAGPAATGLTVSTKHRAALAEQAKSLTLDTILAGLDILAATKARLRNSNHGRVLLEMALVRLGRLEELLSVSQLAHTLLNRQSLPAAKPPPHPAAPELAKKKLLNDEDSSPRLSVASVRPNADGPVSTTGLVELNAQTLPKLWPQILAQLGMVQRADLEKATFLAISGPNTLVLRFPAGYNASRQRCEDAGNIARVEQLLLQLTGQKCRLRIESDTAALDAESSVRNAGDPGNSQSYSAPPREEAAAPPLVKWAEDVLGAKVIKTDLGFGASGSASGERAATTDTEET
jgi:DNA polymerase-3 subunit gamma/tau